MVEEIKVTKKNETWDMVDLPAYKNVIKLRWVFKTIFAIEWSIQKYKARFLAKSYAQQHNIDFKEVFSPIACFEIVRIVLALAAQLYGIIFQFDVKPAFLNEDLCE